MRLKTVFSNILEMQLNKLIGLYPSTSAGLPLFLKIGLTSATFQDLGYWPVSIDLLNNLDNGSARIIAANLMILTGIWSGPVDLFAFT